MRCRDWTTLAVIVLALLPACEEKKPQAGKVCPVQDHGKWTCSDRENALYCDGGKYVAIPCRGAKGCTGKPTEASCDASLGRVGDVCIPPNDPRYGAFTMIGGGSYGAIEASATSAIVR